MIAGLNRLVLLLAVVLVVAVMSAASRAANTNSTGVVLGLPPVILSLDGTSAAVDDTHFSSGHKGAAVIACVVSGQAVNLLVRVQKASNGLFIDIVASDTVTNLDTAVGSMDFSGRSHPSPTEDAVDTAILAAAAGD